MSFAINSNESLAIREKQFSECCDRFGAERIGVLLAAYKMPTSQLKALQLSARLFIARSLGCSPGSLPEEEITDAVTANVGALENMTPNGKLIPKSALALEYNIFLQSVFEMLNALKISDLVNFDRLPTLRYKAAEEDEEKSVRHYATEKPHLESWLGHPKEAVVFHVPLFGDLEHNYVQLYEPPEHYQEQWSDQISDFSHGEEFAAQYTAIEKRPQLGHLYLFSAISLHRSCRTEKSGARISFEFTGVLKENPSLRTAPNNPLVSRPLAFKVQPADMTCNNYYLPKNTYSGAVEIEQIIALDPH